MNADAARDTADQSAWLTFGAALVRALLADGPDDALPTPADRDARLDTAGLIARLGDELDGSSVFAVLAANAGLDVEEAQVLAVLAAAEIEPSLVRDVIAAQRDASQRQLTLGTIMRAFDAVPGHRGVGCLGEDARLRRAAYVDVVADGPWSDHVVRLHPTITWALAGDTSPDPGLPVVHAFRDAPDPAGAPLVVLTGEDRERRRERAVAAAAGRRFLVVDPPTDPHGWSALVREATLTGRGVVVEVDESLSADGRRWIERADHLSWVISSRHDLPIESLPDRPWSAAAAGTEPPTDAEWEAALGPDVPRLHLLAAEQLEPAARSLAANDGDFDAAVRRLVGGGLDGLARRIAPRRTWDDIMLDEAHTAALRTLVDRHRYAHRVLVDWGFERTASAGTVALFTGPSGTGKTLAAEVVANELGLDMFTIDLSAVVSKYIGETEKHLERVFTAARSSNLVLFFDEADALFGKRSEVRDAHDRYANQQVSYLLQRLETYEGLVVLATNFEKSLDDAFVRRIHVRLDFAVPGVDQRRQIWLANLPAAAPIGDVDVDELAERFELTGGLIRNAALEAAFISAASDAKIDTDVVVRGIAREFRKTGRIIRQDDFGPFYELVTEPTPHPPDATRPDERAG